MKSLISKIKKFNTTITYVDLDSIYHYDATPDLTDRYIVWAEQGEADTLDLNDHKSEQVVKGTLDFYTKQEFDPIVDEIQNALDRDKISFQLVDVQFESETRYIHYSWNWEI